MNQTDFAICTIIAKNYIALARTLCNSFLNHHPGGKCYVLIIDETGGYIDPDDEVFELVKLQDLDIPGVKNLAMKYNITEFSTSVKPFLLEYLFTKYELSDLLYLDPDILVTQSLGPLICELDDADIILTPHLDSDYPDDGLKPDDSHIMRSGIYNLGFIGLRNSAITFEFLNWWQTKLYDRCYVNPWAGYMVDQKFMDYAYVLFDKIKLVTDTCYNVAYWNIHSRKIKRTDDGWLCNGQPLRFFHFSNYKPELPDQISGHQTRFTFSQRPDLVEIYNHYRALLMKNGYEDSCEWTYTWGHFQSGKKIDGVDREVFREDLLSLDMKDPFNFDSYPTITKIKIAKRRAARIIKKKGRKLIPGF